MEGNTQTTNTNNNNNNNNRNNNNEEQRGGIWKYLFYGFIIQTIAGHLINIFKGQNPSSIP